MWCCRAATPGRPGPRRRCPWAAPGRGLAVPSSWPNRLRWVWPPGSTPGLRRKPCWTHRTVANGRLSLISTRWAWATVSGSSAQICSSRSPPDQRRLQPVDAERRQVGDRAGRRSSTPAARYRPGPKPKVTVSRAGSSPSSASVSASAGRPWVSRAASSVSSRSIRPSAARSVPARRVNATNDACACGSVATPACRAPWNGSTRPPTVATGVASAAAAVGAPGSVRHAVRGDRGAAGQGTAGGQGAAGEQAAPAHRPDAVGVSVTTAGLMLISGVALMPGIGSPCPGRSSPARR